MRLTVYTDYALRLLMYLAVKEDGCATISEVAQAYGISKSHLMKVAHQLGVVGYIGTVRDKGGGLRLSKAAQEIGLGEVVRYAEPDMALVPCFEPVNAFCPIIPSCVLRRALDEARQAFLRVVSARARRVHPRGSRAAQQRTSSLAVPADKGVGSTSAV